MDDVEEDLALEGEPARSGLLAGGVGRDDDLAQELVPLVLERERDHVRGTGDGEEVDVKARDRRVRDERDREPAARSPLGPEHEARESLEAAFFGREAPLLVGDPYLVNQGAPTEFDSRDFRSLA